MASDWIVATVAAGTGAIAAEAARAIAGLVRRRRNKPSASADFLMDAEPPHGIGSIDMFVKNPSDLYLRPRNVAIASTSGDGYVYSWRAEDSPAIEPHHVTRVSIPAKHFLEAASNLGLQGGVTLSLSFYDDSTCRFDLDYDPEFFKQVCGTFPPPTSPKLETGNHSHRLRSAMAKAADTKTG